jgi:hypothetical protein
MDNKKRREKNPVAFWFSNFEKAWCGDASCFVFSSGQGVSFHVSILR